MDIVKKTIRTRSGHELEVTTVKTTKEDGFVENTSSLFNRDHYGGRKWEKGKTVTKTVKIKDPKLNAKISMIVASVLLIVGFCLLFFHLWLAAVVMIIVAVAILIQAIRDYSNAKPAEPFKGFEQLRKDQKADSASSFHKEEQ